MKKVSPMFYSTELFLGEKPKKIYIIFFSGAYKYKYNITKILSKFKDIQQNFRLH